MDIWYWKSENSQIWNNLFLSCSSLAMEVIKTMRPDLTINGLNGHYFIEHGMEYTLTKGILLSIPRCE